MIILSWPIGICLPRATKALETSLISGSTAVALLQWVKARLPEFESSLGRSLSVRSR